jgi:hypothetical protein
LVIQRIEFGFGLRLFQRLAPFHLLHEEGRGHGRVVLCPNRRAAQLAQVRGAAHRVLQALVGLVDAHGPLHGHALRCGALRGELVGVGFALQFLPARVDGAALLREAARQAKEFKVVCVQIHAFALKR